jgi:hypothetical protein
VVSKYHGIGFPPLELGQCLIGFTQEEDASALLLGGSFYCELPSVPTQLGCSLGVVSLSECARRGDNSTVFLPLLRTRSQCESAPSYCSPNTYLFHGVTNDRDLSSCLECSGTSLYLYLYLSIYLCGVCVCVCVCVYVGVYVSHGCVCMCMYVCFCLCCCWFCSTAARIVSLLRLLVLLFVLGLLLELVFVLVVLVLFVLLVQRMHARTRLTCATLYNLDVELHVLAPFH